MYKVIIKFESEEGSEKSIIKNEVQAYTCKNFSFVNDAILGIQISDTESVMIPIRRIRDIKVNIIGDDK